MTKILTNEIKEDEGIELGGIPQIQGSQSFISNKLGKINVANQPIVKTFAEGARDNDNTGGGATLTYDLEIDVDFIPRVVEASGFIINSTGLQVGLSSGYTQRPGDGQCTGFRLTFVSLTNVVSGLSFGSNTSFTRNLSIGTQANVVIGTNLETQLNPLIPSAIDGGGNVTSYYTPTAGKSSVVSDGWSSNTMLLNYSFDTSSALTSASWTNNSFFSATAYDVFYGDALLMSGEDPVTYTNNNAYAIATSWTDRKVIIRLVSAIGWRLNANFRIYG